MYFSIIYNHMSKSCLNRSIILCQKREVSLSLPSLDSQLNFLSCIWFDLLIFEVSKAFSIRNWKVSFSLPFHFWKRNCRNVTLSKKYFRYLLYLVFLFGISHIKGNEKQIHAFAFAFRLCAKNDLGKVHLVCALCSLFERIVIFFP